MHDNPYAVPTSQPIESYPDVRKVSINPIQLFSRGFDLIRDQYWLFLGITFVGIILASMVPFGIILGPMLVGIYLCFLQRERGETVEFGTLFRGFDQFIDSLVATLIFMGLSFLLIVPVVIVMFVLVILPTLAAANNGGGPPELGIGVLLMMYPVIIGIMIAIYIPFIFVYQLIAERRLKAMEAIKLSARGAWINLFGVLLFLIVMMIASALLTLMCYVPALLFMPVSFAALFVLYRDVFPQPGM